MFHVITEKTFGCSGHDFAYLFSLDAYFKDAFSNVSVFSILTTFKKLKSFKHVYTITIAFK